MTVFDLFKNLDAAFASRIILDLAEKYDDAKALKNHLNREISEDELQQINAAAQREGRQPLSFSFRQ